VTLKPGTVVGPYEIAALIGSGGMGEVYKARDVRLDRTVAIKILPAALADDPDARIRFEREARAVAALNHPHICTLHDVGPDYLVMEMVDGQPLAGPLPLARALEFASQIVSALDAAHQAGITHRDLKPGNILVTKQGVKLLDFGLAKLNASGAAISLAQSLAPGPSEPLTIQQTLTGEHTIVGTVQYMSPEQAQGKPADARSDIFAFGLVLYEMLTGRRAFDGTNSASVIAAILERDAPSAAGVAPPALERLLQRCLAKDPDQRWQSAADINHALAMVGETSAATGPAITRRGTLAVASLVGFLVAAGIGIPLWWSWPRPEPAPPPLSFHLTPPADTELQFSAFGGGSAISPDDRSVAFVALAGGIPRLWIRTLDSLTARQLPDTDGARQPFWSPDSNSIGFFTSVDLRRADVSGAQVRTLARALDPRGGAWNADGTIVFANSLGPLYQVSASNGTPVPLTTLAGGETNHRWPRFLPDGRTLVYYAQGTRPGVYLTTLDRPDTTQFLLNSPSDAAYIPGQRNTPGHLLWVARDTVMAQRFDPQSAQLMGPVMAVPGTGGVASFLGPNRSSLSVSNDGTLLYSSGGVRSQLRWISRDGKPSGTVGAVEQYIGLRLSPDGKEVLVTIRDAVANGDLWRIDLATGAHSPITSEGGGWYAVWSPDSEHVAFTALTRRDVLRMVKARGGGEVQTLSTFDGLQLFPSDWSFDGKYLAYTANSPDTSNDVWLLPMIGDRKPEPLLRSPFTERHAQFSPDGRWLAFTSNERGRDDVYVQSFPDASIGRIVSDAGGEYPRWGPGGSELLYRAPDGHLMTRPVRLARSSVELGTPSVVARLVDPPGVHPYPYDVAADGRILALTPASGAVQDQTLTVLMNWQSALKP
jgi:serine/threonine protein kinase/Tol biopolymer transport system component